MLLHKTLDSTRTGCVQEANNSHSNEKKVEMQLTFPRLMYQRQGTQTPLFVNGAYQIVVPSRKHNEHLWKSWTWVSRCGFGIESPAPRSKEQPRSACI